MACFPNFLCCAGVLLVCSRELPYGAATGVHCLESKQQMQVCRRFLVEESFVEKHRESLVCLRKLPYGAATGLHCLENKQQMQVCTRFLIEESYVGKHREGFFLSGDISNATSPRGLRLFGWACAQRSIHKPFKHYDVTKRFLVRKEHAPKVISVQFRQHMRILLMTYEV